MSPRRAMPSLKVAVISVFFFALLAFCTLPGQSPSLATSQLSTKFHKCKHDRKLPSLAISLKDLDEVKNL